ncbi:MAG: hypothetical protein GIW99_11030 [Candidatus Eremiobacteraeota bacterium]|nr:hypothetical protein [Candidatus Eremiobacteraeota bacterium]MBC5828193.1 hypothetical protein [Candidatus Eremiobacteraeota bacterium]
MKRLGEADIHRLVNALSGSSEHELESAAGDAIDSASTALRAGSAENFLGAQLGRTLTSYLKRPIECTSALAGDGALDSGAWRYEGERSGRCFWLEVEPALGAALADAAIGGPGDGEKVGRGWRVRELGQLTALRFFRCFAEVAGIDAPAEAAFSGFVDGETPPAGCAGTCAFGSQPLRWRAGVMETAKPAAARPFVAQSSGGVPGLMQTRRMPADRENRASEAPPGEATSTDGAQRLAAGNPTPPNGNQADATLAPSLADDAHGSQSPMTLLNAALAAACRRIGDLTGRESTAGLATASAVESPALPSGLLRLALATGGRGAVMVSADNDSVTALAAAALGSTLRASADKSSVLMAASESILRAALHAFGDVLRTEPNRDQTPAQIVRLPEGAMPAQARNHAVSVNFLVGANDVSLQFLVPVWMTERPAPSLPGSSTSS